MKKCWLLKIQITIFLLIISFMPAAMANADSGYLTYQNPAANSVQPTFSTFSYILQLLITFGIVVGLAYYTSKILSKRLSATVQSKTMTIRDTVPLGANKSLHMVEVNNKILLLGVTDHNIVCLQEYDDEALLTELRRLNDHGENNPPPSFQNIFHQQIDALQRLTGRVPGDREER